MAATAAEEPPANTPAAKPAQSGRSTIIQRATSTACDQVGNARGVIGREAEAASEGKAATYHLLEHQNQWTRVLRERQRHETRVNVGQWHCNTEHL